MDEDIVALLKERDQKGIEWMIERYERLIRYILGTILRERESEVEECLNDVYMKVWLHAGEYDYEKASFRTYIKAIARNAALNRLRTQKRLEELEGYDETDPLQSDYIDYSQNIEQRMIFREEVKTLEQILNELSKKDRELVLRRFYYLQSSRQIAEAMLMSENAVDSKLSRLKKKIRKRFEKEMRE